MKKQLTSLDVQEAYLRTSHVFSYIYLQLFSVFSSLMDGTLDVTVLSLARKCLRLGGSFYTNLAMSHAYYSSIYDFFFSCNPVV